MSNDKTNIASTRWPPKKKHQYSAETLSKMKLQRRELYKELSSDKKESILLQRRSKQFESKNQRVQTTLTIREPSSITERAHISLAVVPATELTATSGKGKNLTEHFSNMLKAMRLKELAVDLENQRNQNDAKGKKVSTKATGTVKNVAEGNGLAAENYDRESLDKMLAAFIQADED